MSNLPRDTYHQHLYPRLRGYSVGEDGETTIHLSLGLPCCGLDLLVEAPPHMTALELCQVAGEFLAHAAAGARVAGVQCLRVAVQ